METFASRVIRWQRQHGRHTLPWQCRDPYRIWLSEIMLQQTQVAAVVPYFERFVARFPTLAALANAHEDAVLALWSGLGYYSRARNLIAAAREIAIRQNGVFPENAEAIALLPGVGRSTAAAIAALAYGQRCAILDGNVKRVLARHGGIEGWPGHKTTESALWQLAESFLPTHAVESYTQGMMDLGALICTRSKPDCSACPIRADCVAHAQNRTAQLPTPRPRKTLPERQVKMLLLVDQDKIFLEKRPPRGIWGSLWSLPEMAIDHDPVTHCRDHLALTAANPVALPPCFHSFTHFKLHIHPVLLRLSAQHNCQPDQIWLAPTDALNAALPAPIRKLISANLARAAGSILPGALPESGPESG